MIHTIEFLRAELQDPRGYGSAFYVSNEKSCTILRLSRPKQLERRVLLPDAWGD
jgi:hypothetical protein